MQTKTREPFAVKALALFTDTGAPNSGARYAMVGMTDKSIELVRISSDPDPTRAWNDNYWTCDYSFYVPKKRFEQEMVRYSDGIVTFLSNWKWSNEEDVSVLQVTARQAHNHEPFDPRACQCRPCAAWMGHSSMSARGGQ